MDTNLQNFPRVFYQKHIRCLIPTTAQPGQIFYFNPDGNIDESIVIGLQFLPSNGYSSKLYIGGNRLQATSTDAASALITLVNNNTDDIMQDYPVNGLFNGSSTNVQKVNRMSAEISLKKCFIKWTGASPASNTEFLFSIFYKQKN